MKSQRLYVDVDTQIDFCDPSGALFVRGAPAVMDNVRRLVRAAVEQRALLVGSVDSHNFTAWEFAANGGPFPPHCVKGTPGWLKVPGTLPERSVFIPNLLQSDHSRIVPSSADAVLFEKEVYSLFANPEAEPLLDALLAARGLRRDEVEVCIFGVATDFCVKAAALGFIERGYKKVIVARDAIAAVTEDGGRAAIAEMQKLGVHFETTEALA